MLSSQVKTIIRWASILIVGLGYYFWLGIVYLPFGNISEKESVLLSGPISLEQHRAILENVMDATNTVYSTAVWGFLVCVSLILLIFSKVR
ncbi:hypothetical protein [Aeromonas veronii]|uniref:hypothetical protein n=1 Tax=Aeromonas veronii TaxID=654 RepID=UPI001115DCED|nr:hypothetical protein [Aeromonas veronii]NJI08724.1 hypothetical protein [Aeromonas veronii]